ncbi:LacI family DNA-binding transcriptional regulator [Armatimonas rosea]|uniref:DNA-binding LacI/PurR family transcriptional regulator n=1 Tax=Armatimonas rosea TaxID=685828 RepID=A0A7W9W4T8_ARMRO|nr:LacI family DNA-binding transcriptional regulator [Armatimonas rosea]MBB6048888.1 DNA-binding LacI/PurR family transcriptional regulator [Armatimonas rosea]
MVTIRDVARESGVSVATVSYVLNNGPRPVSPKTRERVVAVMRRLDYHPNAVARSLVRRRTQTLGVVVGHVQPEVVTNNYYAGVLAGIFAGAYQRSYNVVFFTEQGTITQIERHIRTQQPDGVLMIAPDIGLELPARLGHVGIPLGIVGAEGVYTETGALQIDVDNVLGTRLAVEHLLERGHTQVLHMMGTPGQASVQVRREVFEQVMREHGLSITDDRILECTFDPVSDAQLLAQRLAHNPPTAIFAGNDDLALTALQVIKEQGLRIPEDIAVVGFDDGPLAAHVAPGLTTIRQPMRAIGEAIVCGLADQLEGTHPHPEVRLLHFAPELIVRGST